LKIDKNITELQRLILVFTHAEKNTTTKQIAELHAALVLDIGQLKQEHSFQEGSQKERIFQMQTAVENFGEKISALHDSNLNFAISSSINN